MLKEVIAVSLIKISVTIKTFESILTAFHMAEGGGHEEEGEVMAVETMGS